MTIINIKKSPGGTYEYYTGYTVTTNVAANTYTFTVSQYVKKTALISAVALGDSVTLSVRPSNTYFPELSATGAFSVNTSSMSLNESKLLFSKTFVVPAKIGGVTHTFIRIHTKKDTVGSYLDMTLDLTGSTNVDIINFSAPSIETKGATALSENVIRVKFSYLAPYTCKVEVGYSLAGEDTFIYETAFESASSSYNGYYDVTDLLPYTYYNFRLRVTSLAGTTAEQGGGYEKTLPKPVTSIHFPELYVNEGDILTITPTILPPDATFKTLSWSTSEHFQTLFAGEYLRLKGVLKGDVNLTATLWGGGVSYTEILHVMRSAESIIPSREKIRILIGETFHLSCVILPTGSTDTTLSYESDDENVATVSNGNVVGVAEGETTVTITLQRNQLDSISAVVSVAVLSEPEWIPQVVPDFVSFLWVEDFFNNLVELESMLKKSGLLTRPNTGYNTRLGEMSEVFTDIESSITALHAELDFDDSFYDTPPVWSGKVTNFRERIKRWVDWSNQVFTYLYERDAQD